MQYSSTPTNHTIREKCFQQRSISKERISRSLPGAQWNWGQLLRGTDHRHITLTGHEVTSDDLHVCHRLKCQDKVILKLEDRKLKSSIRKNIKVLQQKSLELLQLNFLVSSSSGTVCAMKTNSWFSNVVH